jgi:UMF1 family MFS transporter
VGATAVLATWGVWVSLIAYAVGTVAFNTGAVVYDALLPKVSTPETRGRVSGLGVAVGYIGSLIALGLGALLLDRFGYAAVFRGLAAAFLLFALPSFFAIPEGRPTKPQARRPGPFAAPRIMVGAWQHALRYPGVVRFLAGRFLYTDAINTVFLFNAVFAKLEMGFTDAQTDRLAVVGVLFAMTGAALAGRLVDVLGPRRVLLGALGLQMACLVAMVAAAVLLMPGLGWLAGAAGGAGVGAAWASDRVLMLRLTPPPLVGEFFGLYQAVGRFATVTGPLVWALATDVLGWGRVGALGVLGVFIVSSGLVIRGVSDAPGQAAAAPAV